MVVIGSLLNAKVQVTIPPDTIWGLMTGQYKLYGGVIRWAAGTPYAGQIVRILLPTAPPGLSLLPFLPLPDIGNLYNTYQIHRLLRGQRELLKLTRELMAISTSTMRLAGLNLAVSAVGFSALNQRLSDLDKKLEEVRTTVKLIKEWLDRDERSRLRSALADLARVGDIKDSANQRAVVLSARQVLGPLVHNYAERLAEAKNPKELEVALAAEEYYCIVALAYARCWAELGEWELAQREIQAAYTTWQTEARRIARELLLRDNPQRLLYHDTLQASAADIVAWLDFAHDEERGFAWIDHLREKLGRWHKEGGWGRNDTSKQDREIIAPALLKLTTRDSVLQGHLAQMTLLANHKLTPSTFERKVAELSSKANDGYLVLDMPNVPLAAGFTE